MKLLLARVIGAVARNIHYAFAWWKAYEKSYWWKPETDGDDDA